MSGPVFTIHTDDSLEADIAAFFARTYVTRAECDRRAAELTGNHAIVPVPMQGSCSYTVYAGQNQELIVQFRLKQLELEPEIADLVSDIYGELAPTVSLAGEMSKKSHLDENNGRDGLLPYVMSRMKGLSSVEFKIAHIRTPDDSVEKKLWRNNLMIGLAHFMALAWNAPQPVDTRFRNALKDRFLSDLRLLHDALPDRFHTFIKICRDSMDDIMSLPMVLLHQDLSGYNIMVDDSCHLVGVIDWAESQVGPFGTNLHTLEFHTTVSGPNGTTRHVDFSELYRTFWQVFDKEAGGLTPEQNRTVRRARILGLLRSNGFYRPIKGQPGPVAIADDDWGRYQLSTLDDFLINPGRKLDGLE